MVATVTTSIEIQEQLLHQAEILAKHLNISQNQLFQTAIEQFIWQHQSELSLSAEKANLSQAEAQATSQIIVNQGDIYWLNSEEAVNVQTAIPHPYLVVQENIFNHSRLDTVVVCSLTSNLKRASLLGNVLLEANEANLPKQSVVEISKLSTVAKAQLGEHIGSLSEKRIKQIITGMRFLQLSFFAR